MKRSDVKNYVIYYLFNYEIYYVLNYVNAVFTL